MKILRTLLNVGFVIIIMFMVILKYEITFMSLENIEAMHTENVSSLCCISQPKNLWFHLIIQELGKLSFKINVIPNGLEKVTGFNINNELIKASSYQVLHYIVSLKTWLKMISSSWFKNLIMVYQI